MPILGLFSRKLNAPELTTDLEELLINIGHLEERLAPKHHKKGPKPTEAELNHELEQLRHKLLDAKATIGNQKKTTSNPPRPDRIEIGHKPAENRLNTNLAQTPKNTLPATESHPNLPAPPEPAGLLPNPPQNLNLPAGEKRSAIGDQRSVIDDSQRIKSKEQKAPESVGQTTQVRWSVESIASELHPKINEDNWLISPGTNAAAVFDGVSAASLAAEASLRAGRQIDRALKAIIKPPQAEELPDLLGTLLHGANDLLWRINQANKNNELATTATLAMVTTYQDGPAVAYASVGDSRLSIWHAINRRYELAALDDQLLRLLLTSPASRPAWVASILQTHQLATNLQVSPVEMIKLAKVLDGLANPTTASPLAKALFAERNLVTQSLGLPTITPHIGLIKLQAGDRLLLATDGLHDNLTEAEIIEIISRTPISEAAAALVVRAHEVASSTAPRAKKDDITAIVLEIL